MRTVIVAFGLTWALLGSAQTFTRDGAMLALNPGSIRQPGGIQTAIAAVKWGSQHLKEDRWFVFRIADLYLSGEEFWSGLLSEIDTAEGFLPGVLKEPSTNANGIEKLRSAVKIALVDLEPLDEQVLKGLLPYVETKFFLNLAENHPVAFPASVLIPLAEKIVATAKVDYFYGIDPLIRLLTLMKKRGKAGVPEELARVFDRNLDSPIVRESLLLHWPASLARFFRSVRDWDFRARPQDFAEILVWNEEFPHPQSLLLEFAAQFLPKATAEHREVNQAYFTETMALPMQNAEEAWKILYAVYLFNYTEFIEINETSYDALVRVAWTPRPAFFTDDLTRKMRFMLAQAFAKVRRHHTGLQRCMERDLRVAPAELPEDRVFNNASRLSLFSTWEIKDVPLQIAIAQIARLPQYTHSALRALPFRWGMPPELRAEVRKTIDWIKEKHVKVSEHTVLTLTMLASRYPTLQRCGNAIVGKVSSTLAPALHLLRKWF